MYRKIAKLLIATLFVCNTFCYGSIADGIENLNEQIKDEESYLEESSFESELEEIEESEKTEELESETENEELVERLEEETKESEEKFETESEEESEREIETELEEKATDSEIADEENLLIDELQEEPESEKDETEEIATDSEIVEEMVEGIISEATESEILFEEVSTLKFILASESFIERDNNTYRMIKDLYIGDSLYLIGDEFYYFDGENYITTETDEEKLSYENIDEIIENNSDRPNIVLDMNGFDIISINEERDYDEKESLFKVYGNELVIYGNYSLYNEEHKYLEEGALISDFGHIIPKKEEQGIFLDDVKLELNNVYINGGDGRDSSNSIGGHGANAIYFSQDENNSLAIYNGAIKGGKGGAGKGASTSFGGGVLTGLDGTNYRFAYSRNGANGDKGCGYGGNAIFTECDSVLTKTIVKDASINGGNGGKRKTPLLKTLPNPSNLPEYFCIKYDEPQYFTSVKNQAGNSLCSSFALMGVIESDILRNYGNQVSKIMHSDSKELNFSEKMYAYTLRRPQSDPLGNYTITNYMDQNSYQTGNDSWWNAGSNYHLNPRFLSTWQAPVAEYKDAYNSHGLGINGKPTTYQNTSIWPVSENEAPVIKLKDFGIYDFTDKTYSEYGSEVKKLISEHGALSIGLMVTTSTGGVSEDGADYTRADGKNIKYVPMYRKDVSPQGGHDMTLIGWDDNFPKENFSGISGENTPEHDGAWIVKNSWGPENNENAPLYYISYDHSTEQIAEVSYYHMAPSDEFYDYNYMYSFVLEDSGYYVGNGDGWGTVYEIKHDKERLSAVSYMTSFPVDNVTMYIIPVTNTNVEPVLDNKIYTKTNIKIKEGYNLITIDTPIYAKNGEKYMAYFMNQTGSDCAVGYMSNDDPYNSDYYTIVQSGNNFNYSNWLRYNNNFTHLESGHTFPISILTEDVPKNFSIKFDANSGTGTVTKNYQKLYRDATISDLSIQKEYSTLKGFSFDSSATTATYNIGSNVYDIAKAAFLDLSGNRYDNTDTITLYAVWEGHDHSYGNWTVATPPTCTVNGTEKRTCTVCGHFETRSTNALGHDLGEWFVATSATCAAPGTEKKICSRCEYFETRPISATGHNFGNWTVATPPTCTVNGTEKRTCTVCGHFETRSTNALGHDLGEWFVATPATCAAPGTEKKICSRCEYFETRPISATGHTNNSWETVVAATCTTGGTEKATCSVCFFVTTRNTSSLGHSGNPCVRCGYKTSKGGSSTSGSSGGSTSGISQLQINAAANLQSTTTQGKLAEAKANESLSKLSNEVQKTVQENVKSNIEIAMKELTQEGVSLSVEMKEVVASIAVDITAKMVNDLSTRITAMQGTTSADTVVKVTGAATNAAVGVIKTAESMKAVGQNIDQGVMSVVTSTLAKVGYELSVSDSNNIFNFALTQATNNAFMGNMLPSTKEVVTSMQKVQEINAFNNSLNNFEFMKNILLKADDYTGPSDKDTLSKSTGITNDKFVLTQDMYQNIVVKDLAGNAMKGFKKFNVGGIDKIYYLGENGVIMTGWVRDAAGGDYFFTPDGSAVVGQAMIDNAVVSFNNDGKAVSDITNNLKLNNLLDLQTLFINYVKYEYVLLKKL